MFRSSKNSGLAFLASSSVSYGTNTETKSLENLFELIDNPNLQPKPKENTYPFGYRTQIHGEKYRYFNEISLNEGTFMGELLKS